MRLDLQLATLIASTAGVGFLMAVSGIQKSLLDWRHRDRFCAACGRQIRGRICGCASGN
jgi:NADH pyrophosphatase NudC (nudix superfamily)